VAVYQTVCQEMVWEVLLKWRKSPQIIGMKNIHWIARLRNIYWSHLGSDSTKIESKQFCCYT